MQTILYTVAFIINNKKINYFVFDLTTETFSQGPMTVYSELYTPILQLKQLSWEFIYSM